MFNKSSPGFRYLNEEMGDEKANRSNDYNNSASHSR
jgi:hypothetical protein